MSFVFALPTATMPLVTRTRPAGSGEAGRDAPLELGAVRDVLEVVRPDWNRAMVPWVNWSREKSPLSFVSAAEGDTLSRLMRSTTYCMASTDFGSSPNT